MKVNNLPQMEQEITLLELLDRLLDKGIVISGDLTLSIADVDLIYIGLRLVIGGIDSVTKSLNDSK